MGTAPAFVPTAVTPGDLLRRARRQADLTQADLGARLAPPVSHAAISDYERGATALDFATLDRLATALGLPLLVEVTLGDIRATVVPRVGHGGGADRGRGGTEVSERRYILVHTHPDNLVLDPLSVRQFAALPLALGPPIESRLYSLQPDLFTDPAIVAALADPAITVICLCLRTSDRYGEAKRLGMTVVEVKDATDAFWRAEDKLPHEETFWIPPDGDQPGYTATTTVYRQRTD